MTREQHTLISLFSSEKSVRVLWGPRPIGEEPGTLIGNSQLGDQLLDSLALRPDPGRQGLIGDLGQLPLGGLLRHEDVPDADIPIQIPGQINH